MLPPHVGRGKDRLGVVEGGDDLPADVTGVQDVPVPVGGDGSGQVEGPPTRHLDALDEAQIVLPGARVDDPS
nr:hypothetical protein [Pseudonocardia sediminis]